MKKLLFFSGLIWLLPAISQAQIDDSFVRLTTENEIPDHSRDSLNVHGYTSCPSADEIEAYFASGLHGEYSAHDVFVLDTKGPVLESDMSNDHIKDYTNNVLFYMDSLHISSSYYTALASVSKEIFEGLNIKVFITDNDSFCDKLLFDKINNDFMDEDFTFAYHIHYLKRKGCNDPGSLCDWALLKCIWKKSKPK